MARLCVPGRRVHRYTVQPNGEYDLHEVPVPSEREFISFQHSIANSSEVRRELSVHDCIELLRKNESDVLSAWVPMVEDSYTVPVASKAMSLHFISGINTSSRHDPLQQPKIARHGVLANIDNFTSDTYTMILVFVVIFSLVTYIKSYNSSMWHFLVKGRRVSIMNMFSRNCKDLLNDRSSQLKYVGLLMFTFYFLLATPFLSLFQTNQIVLRTPYIVNSYARAIESNATVYIPRLFRNDSELLKPNSRDVQVDNIVNRFWRFSRKSIELYNVTHPFKQSLSFHINRMISARGIFLVNSQVMIFYVSTFCVVAVNSGMKVELFVHRDFNQREQIQGHALRKGYSNARLIRLQRRMSEMNSLHPHYRDAAEMNAKNFLMEDNRDTRSLFTNCFKPDSLDSCSSEVASPGNILHFESLIKFTIIAYGVSALVFILEVLVGGLKLKRQR